jgi:transposase
VKAHNRERRLARYEQVVALYAAGLSKLAVSRRTGVSRHTIIRWLAAGHFPERRERAPRPTTLTPHADYLQERWAAGSHNAARLWRELREQRGFRGGLSAVRDWITTRLRGGAPRAPDASLPRTAHPSPRRAAWLFTKARDALTEPERVYVDAMCAACPALATVRTLAADFRLMLAGKDANALAPWLAAAEQSELRQLAVGLRRDRDAVLAAVCFRWSNGQVEGQVNRLKLIKRTMYGRASYPLLRRRVLAA